MLLPEVGVYLAARSIAVPFNTPLTRGGNLFEGDLAGDVDTGVALIEYAGPPPEPKLGAGVTNIEMARFQLMVRHSTHATGRLLLQQIMNALVAVVNQNLTGVYYLSIDALSSNPLTYPRDLQKRWLWSMNFEAMKEVSAS